MGPLGAGTRRRRVMWRRGERLRLLPRPRGEEGMTLVELVVAVTLLALLMLGLGASLGAGLRLIRTDRQRVVALGRVQHSRQRDEARSWRRRPGKEAASDWRGRRLHRLRPARLRWSVTAEGRQAASLSLHALRARRRQDPGSGERHGRDGRLQPPRASARESRIDGAVRPINRKSCSAALASLGQRRTTALR